MSKPMRKLLVGCLIMMAGAVQAQNTTYGYEIDLTRITNDQLQVQLATPEISERKIRFYMPKIVPGTYSISDYGMFISNLVAVSGKGKELPVERIDENTWEIKKANKMTSLSYRVDDIFDTEKENDIYYMAGTNIDSGKNFVINPFGFFGYFEGMKEQEFRLGVTKPEGFYGSTGLIPESTSPTKDVFVTQDYDLLMDSPIMYNEPDTTTIRVGNAEVLISVYSPKNMLTSEYLAGQVEKLLKATARYLDGNLPIEKYAFLFYFESPTTIRGDRAGALEHSYSSFYYLPEYPQERLSQLIVDIASHEFFHIVTPLTLHSEEIEYFNYNEADLSQHLWLYEGVTEYSADIVQVRYGLITLEEYVARLEEKINNNIQKFTPTLPFTEMSEQAAGKYASEYGNVYEKGALIGALLDIRLLELSEGGTDLQDLLASLGEQYGKNKPFKDEELFGIITEQTYPEIGDFLNNYVGGSQVLPYEAYFQQVGINYTENEEATLGNVSIGYDREQARLQVVNANNMNAFGKTLGLKQGDLLVALQGEEFELASAQQTINNFKVNTKKGDPVQVTVMRKNDAGEYEEIMLEATAETLPKVELSLVSEPTYEQLQLRSYWTDATGVVANPKDVGSIDAIIAALYDVISGGPGKRNWDRFQSLFAENARMGAVGRGQDGSLTFRSFTPDMYVEQNGPYFEENGFFEKEIGRKVQRYGEIVNVFSAYATLAEEGGEVRRRGINSIQLAFYRNRWWITHIQWNAERDDLPMPADMVEKVEGR